MPSYWSARRKARKSARRRRKSRSLAVETLEGRLQLSTVTWSVNASGFWDDANNWLDDVGNHRLPNFNDDVVIDRAGGAYTVTFRASIGNQTIKTLKTSTDETVEITGESLRIDQASRIDGHLSIAGGTLAAAGDVTLAGSSTWSSGAIVFNGTIIDSGAVLTISGAADVFLAGRLTNKGTITHSSSGSLLINGSSILDIQTGAVYEFAGDGDIGPSGFGAGFTPFINNAGTIKKTAGSDVSRIWSTDISGINFNNLGGTIDAQVGTIKLDQLRGDNTGATWNASTGAVVEIVGHSAFPATYSGLYTGSGGGTVRFSGGGLNVTSDTGPGAKFDFAPGLFQWTGGGIGNTHPNHPFTNLGTITLSGPDGKGIGGTAFINKGTIINLGPGEFALSGWTFTNDVGATFEQRGDSIISGADQFGNAGRFINAGTFKKTAGTGTVDINARIDNAPTGRIEVQSGRLKFSRGSNGATGGTFDVSAAAALEFVGSDPFNMYGSYTGTGSGLIEFKASLNGGSDSDPAHLNFPVGMFHMVNGGWNNTIQNDGEITLDGTDILGARVHFINAGTILHVGTLDLDLNANTLFENQGLYDITTDADLVVPGDASGGNMRFLNTGVLRKSGGVGTTEIRHDGFNKAFQLNNTGTVEVLSGTLSILDSVVQIVGTTLTAGTWNVLNGSTLSIVPGSNIVTNQANVLLDGVGSTFNKINSIATNQGSFRLDHGRDFTTAGNFINSGLVTLGADSTLAVSGSFTESGPQTTLSVEVGGRPATGLYGQLTTTGVATLAGRLVVALADGFGPTNGDVYQILTYPSHVNSFGVIAGLAPFFSATVDATNTALTSTATSTNITVDPVSVPVGGTVGQTITIPFTVRNQDAVDIFGNWTDSVYLSRDLTFSSDDVLFARVPHSGGLAGNDFYTAQAIAALPAVVDADWHVIVVADSQHQVPDTTRDDNTSVSSGTMHVSVPVLAFGVQQAGSIVFGASNYYRLDVAAGGDVVLTANFDVANEAELLVGYNRIPTPGSFDFSTSNIADLNRAITLNAPQAGSYYILVRGREGAPTPQNYTLSARVADFEIRSIGTNHGSNAGRVTVAIEGSGFTSATIAKLIAPNGTTRTAASVTLQDSNTLFATFDLTGLAASPAYDVQVTDGVRTTTLADSFTVNVGAVGRVDFRLTVPSIIRVDKTGTLVIDYYNVGETDVAAPVMVVTGRNAQFRLPENAEFGPERLEFLAISDSGPAGVLAPGAHGQISVIFAQQTSGAHVTSDIQVGLANPSGPLDWTLLRDALRPPTMQLDAWDAIWANVVADFGTSYSQYQKVLDDTASYLSQLGIYTADISRLLSFRIRIADDFGAITGNYALGPFGRGQNDPLKVVAVTETNGTVEISSAGLVRSFLLVGGKYVGLSGETGTLTRRADGSYRIDELDGSISVFRTDGKLDYLQDINGNRTTYGYDGSARVTTLTKSNGDTTTFTYNAQSRITQITDPVGRVTTYTYDGGGAGEHLIQISDAAGTTRISYVTGQGAAREHAVSSVEFPDGTHLNYEYDTRGRLIRETRDGGAQPITYSYDSVGGVTMTDAAGNVTVTRRLDIGQSGQVTDPLGNVALAGFDSNHKLVNLLASSGQQITAARDAKTNITRLTDPAGGSIDLRYSADFRRLLGQTDARGNVTSFGYDTAGNLTSQTGPDGLSVVYHYDSRGNQTETQFASGRTEVVTYDSHNLVTRRDFSDGSHIEYTYDAHRNLATLIDATGTTAFQYDAADRMTKVTYPNGRFVQYTYDSSGRRSQVKTQDNFVVNYSYDSVGRLSRVSDAANQTIVLYTYDAVGRLSREDFGNQTSTTYGYDQLNQVTSVVSRAQNNSVISQFGYIYDAVGQRTSMTTLDGTTTYGYDARGQLIAVLLPGGRTIGYEYDAAGNRTRVTDSGGSPIDYASNNLDQYTAAGNRTFTYDADGNRYTQTQGATVTTYSYDVQNRLVGSSNGVDTWSYEYDALGNRIAVVHNGVRTEYLVDPTGLGNVIGEYDGSGVLVAHYAHGSGLESRIDAGGNAGFYQYDANGNVATLTGAGGSVLDTYSYLPFGEQLASTGSTPNPFTFVGQFGVMDSGDGLYFMRHRFYDPGVGRFANRDPIGLLGGSPNLYQYVHNNPVIAVDPSGTVGDIVGAAGAALRLLGPLTSPTTVGTNQLFNTVVRLSSPYLTTSESLVVNAVRQAEARALTQAGMALGLLEGIVAATPILLIGYNRAVFDAKFGEGSKGNAKLQFTDDDYVRHQRNAKNNHPLLEATARSIARINGHTEPTAQDYIDAKIAIHTATKDGTIEALAGFDPNDIIGPAGFGPLGYILPGATMPYTIDFENMSTASAPAQEVVVTQQLDADLDWSTFQLGSFGFGGQTFDIPAGRTSYSTRIHLPAATNIGGDPLDVDVTADFNVLTGLLTWRFKSLDSTTGDEPSNPLAGFLPPDVTAPEGQGFVSYVAQQKSGLTTGATIDAKATIVFDTNAPIDTPSIVNTIDAGSPTSSVTALSANITTPSFLVSWSGTDDAAGPTGSGVATYDIFVSIDGGQFSLWLNDTAATSENYAGASGHRYAFYSVATDHVGNVQPTPTGAQTQTAVGPVGPVVGADLLLTSTGPTSALAGKDKVTYKLTVKNVGLLDATGVTINLASILPPGVSVKSISTPKGTSLNGSIGSGTWTIPTLKKKASQTLKVTLNVGSSTAAGANVISSTATATFANQGLINTSDDTTTRSTTVIAQADLSISKQSVAKSVQAGTNLLYTVTVANSGRADATNVSFIDVLPAGTTLVKQVQLSGPAFVLGNSGGQLTNTIASLPAKASATFNILVHVDGELPNKQELKNTATISSSTTDPKTSKNSSTATTRVSDSAASLSPNLNDPSKTDLVVTGSSAIDSILVDRESNGKLSVRINGKSRGSFSPTGNVVVFGRGDNDSITISPLVDRASILFGGFGSDTIIAGGGNSVLSGGDGLDSLTAGSGRNILIGGPGANTLNGNQGANILIGGSSNYDADQAALEMLLAEWGRNDINYSGRIQHLTGTAANGLNGPYFLNSSTVVDNEAVDQLLAGLADDWFFADTLGADADQITALQSGEEVFAI